MTEPTLRKVEKVTGVGPGYDARHGRATAVSVEEPQAELPSNRLSAGDGWRLLRTPASEQGIYEYYRVLLGRQPEPEGLLSQMRVLRIGASTRLDLLASIATSPEARSNGVSGPGLTLIRGAAAAARLTGVSRFVRRRRFRGVLQEMVQAWSAGDRQDPLAPRWTRDMIAAEVTRLREEEGARSGHGGWASREQTDEFDRRLSAIEDAVLELLNHRAEALQGQRAAAR